MNINFGLSRFLPRHYSISLSYLILFSLPLPNVCKNLNLNSTEVKNPFAFDFLKDTATVVPYKDVYKSNPYQKCFCDLQQVWSDGKCITMGTEAVVPLLQGMNPDYDVLLNFVLSSVNIQDVNCSDEKILAEFRHESLFILEDGDMYDEETDIIFALGDYCYEFVEEEDEILTMAKVCLTPPGVPVCSGNSSERVSSLSLNVSLGNDVLQMDNLKSFEAKSPACEFKSHYRSLHLDDVSFHLISDGIQLLWQPPLPAKVPEARSSDQYCLSNALESPSSYAINLCYDDPVIRHETLCKESVCVRKCCPKHHIYHSKLRKCSPFEGLKNSSIPRFYDLQNRSFVPRPDNVLMEYSFPWCSPKHLYIIDPQSNPADEFFLLDNGSLFISLSQLTMPPSSYCIDSFLQEDNALPIKAISCFLEDAEKKDTCEEVHRILYPILIIISCGFLAITLIVYSVIPELHAKLHGKSLLSHVSSLLVAFFCQLIVSWFSKSLSMTGCKVIALGNQVSFLWAFFWLNVMCFDIWWSLKTMSPVPETGESSRRRFALYSVYAWGCPVVISFFTAVMEFLPNSVDRSSLILPGFGVRGCWFQDVKSTWIYFHGFTLSLYVLNIFFFFHVAAILIKGQRSTEGILRTTRKQHKERVYLYLKLFVVMGITWICEVASWQEGTCEYWIFTDIINSLQGVMIFCIFMCNKKVFQKIQSKGVPFFRRLKALVHAPSSVGSGVIRATNSSSQRTTHTSDESSRRLSTSVPPIDNQLSKKY